MLKYRPILKPFYVGLYTNSMTLCTTSIPVPKLIIEHLNTRSILKVSGDQTSPFLQGLITNDMRHIEEGACSMYTMFLNTKGRVMYDAIIYRTANSNSFLVECATSAVTALQKHLSLYRVRRKISIDSLAEEMNVWVMFKTTDTLTDQHTIIQNVIPGSIVPCTSLEETKRSNDTLEKTMIGFGAKHTLTVCRDPRLAALGFRVLAPLSVDMLQLAATEVSASPSTEDTQYKVLRYKLGVGEGVEDLPPGNCFPLEANCDYLHGVSFHKGCYIGQEVTARTHHTGVVRKRIMPVEFHSVPASVTPDAPIQLSSSCSRPVGKLRAAQSGHGLALIRIAESLDCPALKVLDTTCHSVKPTWWPQEAPKDRLSLGKGSSDN